MLFFAPSNLVRRGIIFVRLSTSARYSLRALSDLCTCTDNEPVSVSDIASRRNIPVTYLEQLFGKLRRAGILESVRGAQGGYRLARSAKDITVADILDIRFMPDGKRLRERRNMSHVQPVAQG